MESTTEERLARLERQLRALEANKHDAFVETLRQIANAIYAASSDREHSEVRRLAGMLVGLIRKRGMGSDVNDERGLSGALVPLRIPPRYEHCSLGSFEPGSASLSAALKRAMAFCSGYPHLANDEGLGLLFCGDNGVGKTHLAVGVLRELVDAKGVRGQFWDFHELIREIKSSYDPETKTTELQVLEPVVETDVLLLDDLGAWKMTDWMNDTLFYILNSRYMAKRPTLITTNYQDVPPNEVLAVDPLRRKDFLVERIGQRLRSRLMEMCLVVRMQGSDHRQAKQEANRVAVGGLSSPPTRKVDGG